MLFFLVLDGGWERESKKPVIESIFERQKVWASKHKQEKFVDWMNKQKIALVFMPVRSTAIASFDSEVIRVIRAINLIVIYCTIGKH